jgi:hypothetical protein
MKNKSFLFLIAALAMGLALTGCSSDSDSSTEYVKQGYLYGEELSDAERIMLLFQDAPDVYLEDDTELSGGVLIIPSGKTLHVNGQTVTVDLNTVIVIASGGKLDWDNKATSVISGTSAVVIEAAEFHEAAHYSAGEYHAETNPFGINFGSIGKGKYAGSAGVATGWHTAASSYDDLSIAAGTTGYLIGSFNATADLTPAGTLVVGGNLTLSANKVINSTSPITVYGEIKGGTDAAVTLITGKVSAISANIDGGKIANDLTIYRDGDFGDGDVTFNGKLKVGRDATFGKVTFEGNATVAKQATFTSKKLVTGSVSVGHLAFVSGANNELVLNKDGQIIFTSGTTPTFFTGAGTLAALGGSVSFFVASNKLSVDGIGNGTFAVGNNGINLTAAKEIQVANNTGVYFGGVGSIASANYSIGNVAGTLSSDEGFILTADSIKNTGSTEGTPKITFDAAASDGIFLSLREGLLATNTIRNAIIDGVNIELGANGSIAVYENNLIITNGGSVTAGNIAWSGTIAGTTAAAGGSLLVGSLSAANISANTIPGGSITAGSIGTQSSTPGILVSSAVFIFTDAGVSDGLDNIGNGVKDGGSASTGGSILVFSHN